MSCPISRDYVCPYIVRVQEQQSVVEKWGPERKTTHAALRAFAEAKESTGRFYVERNSQTSSETSGLSKARYAPLGPGIQTNAQKGACGNFMCCSYGNREE